MSQRFYCDTPIGASHARLAGGEAHHLIHVMRATPGDRVVLFDGSGAEFDAAVASIARSAVELEILARREVDREARIPLTLAVPLPKGDRARWLIEKSVELGVARIIPLITSRSTAGKERGSEKLERFVIEASKQCGRNRLMEIALPIRFDELLSLPLPDAVRWIAHPAGEPPTIVAGPVCAAIGPEGGFSDEEVQQAQAAGWRLAGLGPRILRVETAALAVAARLLS
jgi:16S rRNA (uracil1498-N3)-methyltransferase